MSAQDHPEDSPLAEALRRQVVAGADRPAIELHAPGGFLRLDRARLWDAVERMTACLSQRGMRSGDRLAWLGLNHPLQIVALFACARLGAIFMPLNFRLAVAELQQVLDDAAPRWLVHDDSHAEVARALQGAQVLLQEALLRAPDVPTPATAVDPVDGDSPVLLVYTSGTTGRARGALHSQSALLANAAASEWAHGFQIDDVVLSVLPLFHVGGLCIQTVPAVLAGVPVVLQPRFDPGTWLSEVAAGQVTLSLLVPATLRAVIDHPGWSAWSPGRLRGVMTGSSTVPLHYLQAFHGRGVPVGQVYGSTETGPVSVVLRLSDAVAHAGETGWPHPGARLRLIDEHGQDVPPGQTGEVCLRADNLMLGYWRGGAHGVDGLDDGWFHSGDLGCLAADGCLRIVGRAKDMIISGGENIYPAEIENLLLCLPGVQECAVVGVPDVRWGETPVAAIVATPGADLTPDAVMEHLRERIARFKLPRRVVILDALPKSALGKVQKASLQARLAPPVAVSGGA